MSNSNVRRDPNFGCDYTWRSRQWSQNRPRENDSAPLRQDIRLRMKSDDLQNKLTDMVNQCEDATAALLERNMALGAQIDQRIRLLDDVGSAIEQRTLASVDAAVPCPAVVSAIQKIVKNLQYEEIKGVQWSLKSLCVNEQPMAATELILKSIEERMVVNISQLTDISDSCSFQLNRFAQQAAALE